MRRRKRSGRPSRPVACTLATRTAGACTARKRRTRHGARSGRNGRRAKPRRRRIQVMSTMQSTGRARRRPAVSETRPAQFEAMEAARAKVMPGTTARLGANYKVDLAHVVENDREHGHLGRKGQGKRPATTRGKAPRDSSNGRKNSRIPSVAPKVSWKPGS